MSDIGPIPAKDQTNYLLGRLEGSVNSLSSQVATAAEARAQADVRHEAEHAEFRRDIAENRSDIAVLKDNKIENRQRASDQIQKWFVILGIPAFLIGLGTLGYYIINHP